MRPVLRTLLGLAVLGLCAGEAHALVYADGATEDSTYYGNIASLSKSAGGTSETDDKRAKFINKNGTVSLFTLTYDFPDTSLAKGTHTAYFVVDGLVVGTASARIIAVNGSTSYTSSTVTIPSGNTTAYQDKLVGMQFTLDKTVTLSTISFLVVLASATKSANLDLDAVVLPEPQAWMLFALGVAGLACLRVSRWGRRRRKQAVPAPTRVSPGRPPSPGRR